MWLILAGNHFPVHDFFMKSKLEPSSKLRKTHFVAPPSPALSPASCRRSRPPVGGPVCTIRATLLFCRWLRVAKGG